MAARSSLHAKTFAIDGRRIFVGSFNFDPRSAMLNTEMGVLVESPRIALALSQALDARGMVYEVAEATAAPSSGANANRTARKSSTRLNRKPACCAAQSQGRQAGCRWSGSSDPPLPGLCGAAPPGWPSSIAPAVGRVNQSPPGVARHQSMRRHFGRKVTRQPATTTRRKKWSKTMARQNQPSAAPIQDMSAAFPVHTSRREVLRHAVRRDRPGICIHRITSLLALGPERHFHHAKPSGCDERGTKYRKRILWPFFRT
jgi:hypothetical protein